MISYSDSRSTEWLYRKYIVYTLILINSAWNIGMLGMGLSEQYEYKYDLPPSSLGYPVVMATLLSHSSSS